VSRRTTGHLRWGIAALLFLSTVVNYIDRQTLSVLAPHLKTEFGWTNADFAWIVIAFRVAYGGGQMFSGRLLDRIGTRAGLSLTVACYSTIAVLTSLATGLRSFAAFRFLLGAAESANWPGATKAVAEWFPRRESGWAVALFDSGSSIGAAIAPALVLAIFHFSGGWRPAFVITGALGFVWVGLFYTMYRPPETHPRLSADERALILAGRGATAGVTSGAGSIAPPPLSYRTILALPQTWGIVLGKALTGRQSAGVLGAVSGRGSRELFRRRLLERAHQAGMVGGCRAQARRRRVDCGHDAPDPRGLRDLARRAHQLGGRRDLRICRALDHDPEPAGGYLSERFGRVSERPERHRRGSRYGPGHLPDRDRRRSLFVSSGLDRGERDSDRRRRGDPASGAQQRRNQARPGVSDLRIFGLHD
jgi:MFS family permease